MKTSLFDLYKVGVGPSSSHTMGPMRAARRFAAELETANLLSDVSRIQVDLYGSLALTGMGHGTDRAILLGLSGEEPSTIDPASIDRTIAEIRKAQSLSLMGRHTIAFAEANDLLFHRDQMFPPRPPRNIPTGFASPRLTVKGRNSCSTFTSLSVEASSSRMAKLRPPRRKSQCRFLLPARMSYWRWRRTTISQSGS